MSGSILKSFKLEDSFFAAPDSTCVHIAKAVSVRYWAGTQAKGEMRYLGVYTATQDQEECGARCLADRWSHIEPATADRST